MAKAKKKAGKAKAKKKATKKKSKPAKKTTAAKTKGQRKSKDEGVQAADPAMLKRLRGLRKNWKAQREEASKPAWEEVPPGQYIARLVSAGIQESRKKTLCLVTKYCVLRGDQKGTIIHKWDGLEGEQSMRWIAKLLYTLGVPHVERLEIDEFYDVCEHLTQTQPVVRMTVVERGDFTDKRVDKKVDYDEDDEEYEDEEVEEEEDEDEEGDEEEDDEDEQEEEDEEESEEEEELDEDEEEEEVDEEDVDPVIGDIVEFELGGKSVQGQVQKVQKKKQTCTVKVPKKKKLQTVAWDDLCIIVQEDEEEDD